MLYTIGYRLREERNRLGLSQTEFANACGVNQVTQSNYEKDKRNPDSLYLAAAAKLGVDVNYLITGTYSTPQESASNEVQDIMNMLKGMRPEDRESFLKIGAAISQSKPDRDAG